jgi:hypothetical protein
MSLLTETFWERDRRGVGYFGVKAIGGGVIIGNAKRQFKHASFNILVTTVRYAFYLAITFNLSRPDCHEIISVLTASGRRISTRQNGTGSSHFPFAGRVDALVIADVRPS